MADQIVADDEILELTDIIKKGEFADAKGVADDVDVGFEQELEDLFADDAEDVAASINDDSAGDAEMEAALEAATDAPAETAVAEPAADEELDLSELEFEDGKDKTEDAAAADEGSDSLDLSGIDDLLDELGDDDAQSGASAASTVDEALESMSTAEEPEAAAPNADEDLSVSDDDLDALLEDFPTDDIDERAAAPAVEAAEQSVDEDEFDIDAELADMLEDETTEDILEAAEAPKAEAAAPEASDADVDELDALLAEDKGDELELSADMELPAGDEENEDLGGLAAGDADVSNADLSDTDLDDELTAVMDEHPVTEAEPETPAEAAPMPSDNGFNAEHAIQEILGRIDGLEQKLAQDMDAKIEAALGSLSERMDSRLGELEQKIEEAGSQAELPEDMPTRADLDAFKESFTEELKSDIKADMEKAVPAAAAQVIREEIMALLQEEEDE